jgi:nickel-dependent lactate racemase
VHVGFGGGAKLILPAWRYRAINQFPQQQFRDFSRTGLGNFANNIMRTECDAAGDMAGMNFKVDCLVNRRGEIASLYAGPFRATHARGAEDGKVHYGIPYRTGYDIVVSNAYGKANESAIALSFLVMLRKTGAQGPGVLIADSPEGQVPHYVFRAWGSDYGGRHFAARGKGFIPLLMKRLIVLNPAPDRTFLDLVCDNGDAEVVKTWPEVLAMLEKEYPSDARVAVVPDGTVQYLMQPGA